MTPRSQATSGKDRPQVFDRLAMRSALCAHSRSCQTETIDGRRAPSADVGTGQPVIEPQREAASAIETGLRTPIATGDLQRKAGAWVADCCRQCDRVEGRQLD